MTKLVHYLLIATHLPNDSEIIFFKSVEEAKLEFHKRVNELFELDENLESELDYWREDAYAIRFNCGHNQKLSDFLGDVDHYFHVGTQDVEDNCNYYVAEFSEYVDESNINFFNKQNAIIVYNDLVDDSIAIQHTKRNQDAVNRYDNTTWDSDDYGTLFMESDNNDGSTDAFFGFDDVYWTYRIGEIKFGH